jgi:GNAT superfamily N-acetyltransferase
MEIHITEETTSTLINYAKIPIRYDVREILDVEANGQGGFTLRGRRLDTPYLKDYDSIKGEGPAQWMQRFDMSNWALFGAHVNGLRVGGAAVAFKTPGLTLLEDREDLVVLWDIRVSPEKRGQGIGSALFQAAEAWAIARGCRQLKVETQNINAPACRFYEAQGCMIGRIQRFAYPEFPDEVQILWSKNFS